MESSCGSGMLFCTLVIFLVSITPRSTAASPLPGNHGEGHQLRQTDISQIHNMAARGKRDVTEYWKRGSDEGEERELYAPWKNSKMNGVWQLPVPMKRVPEEASDNRLSTVIAAFRDYLDLQDGIQRRAAVRLNSAYPGEPHQVLDKNLLQMARAQRMPKPQQSRRQDSMAARPEFNPTGW